MSDEKKAEKSFVAFGSIYLKGIAMGAADSVPGVSGGTIAIIVGIYERLIEAITSLDPVAIARQLAQVRKTDDVKQLIRSLGEMEVVFLSVLAAGILTSVTVFARVVHLALDALRAETFAFFFGLILASVIVLYEEIELKDLRTASVAFTGFIIAFAVSGATASGFFPSTPLFLFLAGMIAITAMILPGISGSFLLLLMGQYEYLTGALNSFVDSILGLAAGGRIAGVLESFVPVASFVSGAIIGVFSIAYLVRWMLKNYRKATVTFLVSLMAGSLRLPVIEVLEGVATWNILSMMSVLIPVFAGVSSVLVLDKYTADLDYSV